MLPFVPTTFHFSYFTLRKTFIQPLGFFYFTLSNLPNYMTSKINSIQLLAIVRRKYMTKYSMRAVLTPLVNDIKKLVRYNIMLPLYPYQHVDYIQEEGIQIDINGILHTFYGTISTVSADNLGSCALGGFKEGSTAYRFCRHCLITIDKLRETVCFRYELGPYT